MLSLQKNRLSLSQKLFIVFVVSSTPLIFAIICQLDIISALKAALVVSLGSTFFFYRSKHKNAFHLD